jgi:hypothetical protein
MDLTYFRHVVFENGRASRRRYSRKQLHDRSPSRSTHASGNPLAMPNSSPGKVGHLDLHGKQCCPGGIQPGGQELDESITDPDRARS